MYFAKNAQRVGIFFCGGSAYNGRGVLAIVPIVVSPAHRAQVVRVLLPICYIHSMPVSTSLYPTEGWLFSES